MAHGKLVGTGSYVPSRVLTNHDIEGLMATSDAWIREKYGIRERRVAAPEEDISDLSHASAVRALDAAGLAGGDLDLIVHASINRDVRSPATACILQGRLGATGAVAFDMNVGGCPNTVFALVTALNFLEGQRFRRALVVCTEIYSKFIDWSYRDSSCFLGDGSGALVLEACGPGEGVLAHTLHTDGSHYDAAWWPGGGTRPSGDLPETPVIDGKAVWEFGHTVVPAAVRAVAADAGVAVTDLDLVVFHQANANMIRRNMAALGLPPERTHINNDRFGNTGGASSLLALDEALRHGKAGPGDHVVLCSYGAGLAWGAALLRL